MRQDFSTIHIPMIYQKARKEKIPLSVGIELTTHCNLNCRHCYIVKEKQQELSAAELKDILKQLSKMGTLIVGFTGGEIFTRQDLFDILCYARRKRFFVHLLTNGTLITKKIARRLKEIHISKVQISLYGPDAITHDRITQKEGSFVWTLQGLDYLKTAGIYVDISCVLTNLNFKTYEQLGKMCQDIKIPIAFSARIVRQRDGSKETPSLLISSGQLREFFSSDYGFFLRRMRRVNSESLSSRLSRPPCYSGHSGCGITAYGDVVPCLNFPLNLGNLRKNSFYEIWYNSPELSRLRKIRFQDLNKCSKCSYILYCSRCAAEAFLEYQDTLAPSRLDCREAKVIASLY